MSKKNYKLYYATEENGYECEKIAEFNTPSEAIACMRDNIKDDVDIDEEIPTFEHINVENYYEHNFTNANGYDVVYIITTADKEARDTIDCKRREMMEAAGMF